MFVACVIEQLVDEGRLSLDATGAELLGNEVVAGSPNAGSRHRTPALGPHQRCAQLGVGSRVDPSRPGSAMDVSHIWGKTEALDYLKSGRRQATNDRIGVWVF